MVFIDTSNSQAVIKVAQSGCLGRAVGAWDQQEEARAGGSTSATSGCCCRLPALATSSAWWPVLPIKPLQWMCCWALPVCLAVLLYRPVSSVPSPQWGLFSIHLFCASSPGFEVVAYSVWAASSKVRSWSDCPLWLTLDPRQTLAPSHARTNLTTWCCQARGTAEVW